MGDQLSIDIRRQKVLILVIQGYTPMQIVEKLDVSRQTIYRDRVWLREKKKTEIGLVRGYSWDKLNKILEEGKLTPYQEAKFRLELLRIVEPKKVETDGKLNIIFKTDESLEADPVEQSKDAEN